MFGRGRRLRRRRSRFEAIALTCFVLAGNTLLRPLVNVINRAPINQGTTEAIYEVRVTTTADHIDERELLREQLETAHYPPQDIEVIEREQGGIELVATFWALPPIRANSMRSSRASTEARWCKTPGGICGRRIDARASAGGALRSNAAYSASVRNPQPAAVTRGARATLGCFSRRAETAMLARGNAEGGR